MCWQCEQAATTGQIGTTINYIDFGGQPQQVSLAGTADTTVRLVGVPICPDLLTIDYLGEADSWRGHLIRGLFRVVDVVDAAVDWWTH